MSSVFLLCFRWIRLKTRKRRPDEGTGKDGGFTSMEASRLSKAVSSPCLAGVRADQEIKFVVPSYTSLTDTCTEDSYSESDSGTVASLSDWEGSLRKRSRLSKFELDPRDLRRGLYDDFEITSGYRQQGEVSFILHYNFAKQQLVVTILSARDLTTSRKLRETLNSAAKVVLLPGNHPKFVTKIQRNSINPTFNEAFTFTVPKENLDLIAVNISLWHHDKLSKKYFIGQTINPIKRTGINSEITSDVTTGQIWSALHLQIDQENQNRGELLFSLSYNPSTITLTLTILKAKNLPVRRNIKDQESVYVKISLYMRRKAIRSKKTPSTKRLSNEIEFNHKFQVQVIPAALDDMDILISVCERAGLGNKRIIGRTQVGNSCYREEGVLHWQDMIASPKSACAQWHTLA